MANLKSDVLPLKTEADVVQARHAARKWLAELHFSLVDQTKMITAASELARNTIIYGGGGTMQLNELEKAGRKGLELIFSDKGPGIPDIQKALTDGYTTGKGLGLGLSGSKRLCNEFEIQSEVGQGTTITIRRWK